MKKLKIAGSIREIDFGKDLVLSKVTSVQTDKQMIHLDQLADETWRLIYNENP